LWKGKRTGEEGRARGEYEQQPEEGVKAEQRSLSAGIMATKGFAHRVEHK